MFDVTAYLEYQETRKKRAMFEYTDSSSTPIGYGSVSGQRHALPYSRDYADDKLNFLSRGKLSLHGPDGLFGNDPYAKNPYNPFRRRN